MSIGNILLLSQVTIYVITFLFSLFIVIPLTVYEAQFNGHCLLFATGDLNVSSLPVEQLTVQWGDGGYCKYPIVMGILALPLSLFYILWMSLHLFKDYDLYVCNLAKHSYLYYILWYIFRIIYSHN